MYHVFWYIYRKADVLDFLLLHYSNLLAVTFEDDLGHG